MGREYHVCGIITNIFYRSPNQLERFRKRTGLLMGCPLSFAESKYEQPAQSIYPLLYEVEAAFPRIIAVNRRFDDPRPVAPCTVYDIKDIGRAAIDRIKVFHNYFSPEGLAADGIIAAGKTEQRSYQKNKQTASDDSDRPPALRSQRL